jgi:hypothetical protein
MSLLYAALTFQVDIMLLPVALQTTHGCHHSGNMFGFERTELPHHNASRVRLLLKKYVKTFKEQLDLDCRC